MFFDSLTSRLQSTSTDRRPMVDMHLMRNLLAADSSLLGRAILTRTAFGHDAMWLKLLTVVEYPALYVIPMASIKIIRECVKPIVRNVNTESALLIDALTVLHRMIEHDGDEQVATKHKYLLKIAGLEGHLIRLLHGSSRAVQIAALNVLSRSFRLVPSLMTQCLRSHHISIHNFGHFCTEPMVLESQNALSWLVYSISHAPTVRSSYADILPLLLRILRAKFSFGAMLRARHGCVVCIVRCVDEVGRPAETLLLQLDSPSLLIDSILPAPSKFFHDELVISTGRQRMRIHNFSIFRILKVLLTHPSDCDECMLHPRLEKLVVSYGLADLEGTRAYTSRSAHANALMDAGRPSLIPCACVPGSCAQIW
jgi:hypothetical protein